MYLFRWCFERTDFWFHWILSCFSVFCFISLCCNFLFCCCCILFSGPYEVKLGCWDSFIHSFMWKRNRELPSLIYSPGSNSGCPGTRAMNQELHSGLPHEWQYLITNLLLFRVWIGKKQEARIREIKPNHSSVGS